MLRAAYVWPEVRHHNRHAMFMPATSACCSQHHLRGIAILKLIHQQILEVLTLLVQDVRVHFQQLVCLHTLMTTDSDRGSEIQK